ncbi:hypothetical protein FS749_012713 [Ceratobasidium sp. UAMH 11750]|nr:hypothetical protein FS749_012713 [Ceratobasidium sp. UAMH 11750]
MHRPQLILEVVIPISKKRARIQGRDSPPKINKATKRPKRSRQTRRDRVDGFFVSLPIEIFTEILCWSYPGDFLSLARTNKSFRDVLMRRSSRFIWRRAESNLASMGLPPCPPHMDEPAYATLLFTKNCTTCGKSTKSRLDLYLYVRLCLPCRKTQIADVGDFPDGIIDLIPCSISIGPQVGGLDFANYCFLKDARRIDTERAELEASGNVAALEDWQCVQYEAMEERYLHGVKVYDFLRKWEYNEETETVIRERKKMYVLFLLLR